MRKFVFIVVFCVIDCKIFKGKFFVRVIWMFSVVYKEWFNIVYVLSCEFFFIKILFNNYKIKMIIMLVRNIIIFNNVLLF